MPVKNFLKSRFSFVSDSSDHAGPGPEDNAPDFLSIVSSLPLYLQASLSDPSCITTFPSSASSDYDWPTTKFTISINPNSAFFRVIDGDVSPNRRLAQSTTLLAAPSSRGGQGDQEGGENRMATTIATTKYTTTIQYSGTLHAGGKTLHRTTRIMNTATSAQGAQSITTNNNSNGTNGAMNGKAHQETDTLFSVAMMTSQSSTTLAHDYRAYHNHYSKTPTLILTDVRYNRVYAVQRMRNMHVALPLSLQSSRTQADIVVYDVTDSYDACFGTERPAKLDLDDMFAILKMDKRGGGSGGVQVRRKRRGTVSGIEGERRATLQHVKQDMKLAEMLFTKEDVIGAKGTKRYCCCTTVNVKRGVDPFFPIAVALCRDELCCFNI